MTPELTEPRRWVTRQWWALIVLVFATQLGLIFWLGRSQRVVSVPHDLAPALQLVQLEPTEGSVSTNSPEWAAAQRRSEMLALTDPTLFALPHPQGFSGAAWLKVPAQEFGPFSWSEAPRLLALNPDRLGEDFKQFMATNRVNTLPVTVEPALKFKVPELTESEPFPTQSTVRVTGALAKRPLVSPLGLPSWRSGDILSNSLVQVYVAADGRPWSAALVKSGGLSGSSDADQYALREALNARFAPLNEVDPVNPLSGQTWGQLVFEWHTLPLMSTNQGAKATTTQ